MDRLFNIDLQKIAEEAFCDELQKIAVGVPIPLAERIAAGVLKRKKGFYLSPGIVSEPAKFARTGKSIRMQPVSKVK